MVQYRGMSIAVTMDDGRHHVIDVPGGKEAAEAEIERIMSREGPYATGWFTERTGGHLRIDNIRELRAAEG